MGMPTTTKQKLSITLSRDLVATINRRVSEGAGASRSEVIEAWLRRAVRRSAEHALALETITYYESLTAEERREAEAWARFSAAEAGRGDVTSAPRPTPPPVRTSPRSSSRPRAGRRS
jgi:Arc/MetJ-type ribon-helix-helix transcriptional regulator